MTLSCCALSGQKHPGIQKHVEQLAALLLSRTSNPCSTSSWSVATTVQHAFPDIPWYSCAAGYRLCQLYSPSLDMSAPCSQFPLLLTKAPLVLLPRQAFSARLLQELSPTITPSCRRLAYRYRLPGACISALEHHYTCVAILHGMGPDS